MKRNVGKIDRILRLVLAAAVIVLFITGQISGIAAIILGVAAGVFIFTASLGWCGVYSITGLNTYKAKNATK